MHGHAHIKASSILQEGGISLFWGFFSTDVLRDGVRSTNKKKWSIIYADFATTLLSKTLIKITSPPEKEHWDEFKKT